MLLEKGINVTKELEKITNSNLYSRGNSILIKSTPDKNEIIINTANL